MPRGGKEWDSTVPGVRFMKLNIKFYRKVSYSLTVVLAATFASSFTFVGNMNETEDSGKVYLSTKEGLFEVSDLQDSSIDLLSESEDSENLDEEGLSVSASDLASTAAAMRDRSGRDRGNNRKSVAGVKVYSETKGYVDASFDEDWSLILINKEHPIPDDYEFELATIKGYIRSDVRVVPHVLDMVEAAKKDGVNLYICSPYRDTSKQEKLFEKKMNFYIKQGKTTEEAYDLASQTVAIPGTSEHQVGLAFDIITDGHQTLDAEFADTDAGKWLKAHSAEYGFILRYPLGKEDITGIEFEPWHFRYVGKAAALEMTRRGITLEEYAEEIGLVE